MILSIVGPPAIGKSTFIEKLQRYLRWPVVDIAEYRRNIMVNKGRYTLEDENEAWRKFGIKVESISSHDIIIESSGNIWRLGKIYKRFKDVGIFAICITDDRKRWIDRLKERDAEEYELAMMEIDYYSFPPAHLFVHVDCDIKSVVKKIMDFKIIHKTHKTQLTLF